MKILIHVVFLVVFCSKSYSQCNLTHEESNNLYFICHAYENMNQSYHTVKGSLNASFQVVFVDNDGDVMTNFFIDVQASRITELVVPRKVKFYMTRDTFELRAETLYDTEFSQYNVSQMSRFNVDSIKLFDVLQLYTNSIFKVEVIDNRTGSILTCTPYKDLIKEQFNCVLDASSIYLDNKYGTIEERLQEKVKKQLNK